MNKIDLIIDALESVYTAEDMSVITEALTAARELRELKPVAWGFESKSGDIIDCITPAEHDRLESQKYVIPLYALGDDK